MRKAASGRASSPFGGVVSATAPTAISRLPERARPELPHRLREVDRRGGELRSLGGGRGRHPQPALEAEAPEHLRHALDLLLRLEVPALVVARARVAADDEDAVEAPLERTEHVVRVHHPRAHEAEDLDRRGVLDLRRARLVRGGVAAPVTAEREDLRLPCGLGRVRHRRHRHGATACGASASIEATICGLVNWRTMIAPVGQTTVHFPHPSHAVSSITATSRTGSTRTASNSHTSVHRSHERHSAGLTSAWYSFTNPSGVLSRWRDFRRASTGAGSMAALRTTRSAGIASRRPVSMSFTSTTSFPPFGRTLPGG